MLGLYQLGYRVLHGLGLYERFATESVECKRYGSFDNHGEAIAEWSLEPIAGRSIRPFPCDTNPGTSS